MRGRDSLPLRMQLISRRGLRQELLIRWIEIETSNVIGELAFPDVACDRGRLPGLSQWIPPFPSFTPSPIAIDVPVDRLASSPGPSIEFKGLTPLRTSI